MEQWKTGKEKESAAEMKKLSVLIPCFNEEEVFPFLVKSLQDLFPALEKKGWDYEVLLVDDGSADLTWPMICDWAASDPKVRGISLSRNFGHQAALSCAYQNCTGDAAVSIDADLQDPPEIIPDLLRCHENGAEIVFAVRLKREEETAFKKTTASLYYRLLNLLGVRVEKDCGDFRLMSRRAVDALNQMQERNRLLRAMVGWVGYKTDRIYFVRPPRKAGTTKYPFRKMLFLAADGIISFSNVPLRIAYLFAFFLFLFVFSFMIYCAVKVAFFNGELVPGWTSLFLSNAFLGIGNLLCLGFIGEYIGRIYSEVKQRPLFLIGKETGEKKHATAPENH